MKEIELIIKINEEQYKFIKQSMTTDKVKDYHALLYDICEHIKNGIPLPEEYGDLVDRDDINDRFNAICDELETLSNQPTHKELLNKLSMCLDTAEPIIESNHEEIEKELWK